MAAAASRQAESSPRQSSTCKPHALKGPSLSTCYEGAGQTPEVKGQRAPSSMTSQLGLSGLSCAARTSPQPHRYQHKPGDSPSPVPGIRARNIFLHTWNLKSSEMTGSWMSRRAGGGDSARIFCSLGGGEVGADVCGGTSWRRCGAEAGQGHYPQRQQGRGCAGVPESLLHHTLA